MTHETPRLAAPHRTTLASPTSPAGTCPGRARDVAPDPEPDPDPDPQGELWQDVFGELQALVEQVFGECHAPPLAAAEATLLRAALRGAVLEAATCVIRARRRRGPLTVEAARPALRALRDVRRVLQITQRAGRLPGDAHRRLVTQSRRASQALRLASAGASSGLAA